ncbi:uncharacterized protein LOC116413903 [Apis florea]|uniref:uncharacterized protein LOC116413903 n=1 Tax=Apis florea TaxID=7463 RepID=UPI0012FF05D5|nr:uncharacterized protein LOC116413903 [Apis florea]
MIASKTIRLRCIFSFSLFAGGPQYNVRSPEGSTLSVCGDSEREELSDNDIRTLCTPRDDQSELSFYRRIIEGSINPLASENRSSKIVDQSTFQDTSYISPDSNTVKQNTADDKSKKNLGYKPYTIEEYRTLSIPKLDRSLGPDKVEMQAKREWLMRRRSYGNSVSARNRQRILLQTHRLKLQDTVAEKCFLPPLKNREIDTKVQDYSIPLTIFEDDEIDLKNSDTNSDRYSKKSRDAFKISLSRKSKKFERIPSFCSSLNSHDFIEDSYLESLRQRQL